MTGKTPPDTQGPAPATPDAFLEKLALTERHMDFLDALRSRDWQKAGKLASTGIDIFWREKEGLRFLLQQPDMDAVALLEQFPEIRGQALFFYPLIAAAEGNTPVFDYLMSRNPSTHMLNEALVASLNKGNNDIADRILEKIYPDNLQERGIFFLLLHRPDMFREAMEKISATSDPAYALSSALLYYGAACGRKNEAAMDAAFAFLPRLMEQNDAASPLHFQILISENFREAAHYVLQSGNIRHITQFIGTFSGLPGTPPDLFLRLASATSDIPLVDAVIAATKADEDDVRMTMLECCIADDDRNAVLAHLMEKYPQATKRVSNQILGCHARAGNSVQFFAAIAAGAELPTDLSLRTLLIGAFEGGNADISDFLLEKFPDKNDVAAFLRLQGNLACQKTAAELSGDIRADDDRLYWLAAAGNDMKTMKLFDDTLPVLARDEVLVNRALRGCVARNDLAAIGDMIRRALPTPNFHRTAFTALLRLPDLPAAAASDKALMLPLSLKEPLTHDHIETIFRADPARTDGNAAGMLSFLLETGHVMAGDVLVHALDMAVTRNLHATAEYLLGLSAQAGPLFSSDENSSPEKLARSIDKTGDRAMLALLRKWAAREQRATGNEQRIAFSTATTGADFAERQGVFALEAAYADCLPVILDRMERERTFTPALLWETRDPHGNTLLDILGAHGRLNDILRPSLWETREQAEDMRRHVHPAYRAQMDMQTLHAAIDRRKLRETTLKNRPGLRKD